MKDYFFNTRDDFHYDHSGYYGYIVFNGDKQTCDGLLKALGQGAQPGGLGWYRYGKSFRPANDGKMYHWYIRLHSGGSEKPAAQAVDDFLRGHLEPPKPSPQPVQPQPAVPVSAQLDEEDIRRVQQVLGNLDAIEARFRENLDRLEKDASGERGEMLKRLRMIEAGVRNLQEVNGPVNEARVEAARLQDRLEEAQGALEGKDRQIESLNKQLSTTDKSAEIQELNAKETRLSSKVNYQEGLIGKYKEDLQEAQSENNTLKEKLEIANTRGDEWEEKYHKLKSEKPHVSGDESDEDAFENTVRKFAPDMYLIRGTTDIVRHEFQYNKPVLELLRRIVLVKGFNGRNKIAHTKWRESHVGNTDWRMYFCKENRIMKGCIVAFLSDKNSQDDDIRWMQAHSPDSCI